MKLSSRDHCKESMDKLTQSLAAFVPGSPEAKDPLGICNDIRLAAVSLAMDCLTGIMLEQRDAALEAEVVKLLKRAKQIMPPDMDPRYAKQIHMNIQEILYPELEEV